MEDILILSKKSTFKEFISTFRNYEGVFVEVQGENKLKVIWKKEPKKSNGDILIFNFTFAFSVEEALKKKKEEYFNLVVVDGRGSGIKGREQSMMFRFLNILANEPDPEEKFPMQRVIALISPTDELAEVVFALGKYRIGSFLTDPLRESRLFQKIQDLWTLSTSEAKIALCLAAGGIEAILYQLGVVRALNTFFTEKKITDFDIYCGVSGGAFLAALLANKVPPEEIIKVFEKESMLFDPISNRTIYDFNLPEYLLKISRFYLNFFNPISQDSLVSSILKNIPTGFFRGVKLQKYLQRQLNKKGLTDNFRELSCKLYIAATDQDTSKPVIFGDEGFDDVAISTAVRASSALTPFYAPEKIGGRWYVDGCFSKTSNFKLAISRGAKLIVIINSFQPVVSDVPGYVQQKGGYFAGIQGFKTMASSRFEMSLNYAMEKNPDIDFYIFRPDPKLTRIMAGSPEKHDIRMMIEKLAYEQTVDKVLAAYNRFEKGFSRFGFKMSTENALRERVFLSSGMKALKEMLKRPLG